MNHTRSIDSTELRDLGRSAVDLSNSHGIGLTEAVVRTIGHQKLSQHQVRRVVEAANHQAFASKYAATSGVLRAVEFDAGPADPEVVLGQLRSTSMESDKSASFDDYGLPPMVEIPPEVIISAPVQMGSIKDVYRLQDKLAWALEECIAGAEAARWNTRAAFEELHKQASSALVYGATPDDLIAAWSRIDGELAKVASDRLGMRLTGVKTASEINPDHHVVGAFATLHAAMQDSVRYTNARMTVETELAKLSAALREYR
jgi:hypothetical protein